MVVSLPLAPIPAHPAVVRLLAALARPAVVRRLAAHPAVVAHRLAALHLSPLAEWFVK